MVINVFNSWEENLLQNTKNDKAVSQHTKVRFPHDTLLTERFSNMYIKNFSYQKIFKLAISTKKVRAEIQTCQ